MKESLDFYTSYNTFFITSDNGATITEGWLTEDDNYNKKRLYKLENLLVVKTGSYGHIKGEVDLLSHEEKSNNLGGYDHVVEGSINVQSGELQVLECPGSESVFAMKIEPGRYRVRVYSSNLSGADIDENEGNDYYKIEMWLDTNKEIKVLKQYQ